MIYFSNLFSWNPCHLRGVEVSLNQLVEQPLNSHEKLMQGTNGKIYRVQVPSNQDSSIWKILLQVQHFVQSYLNTGDHLSAISELTTRLEQEVANTSFQHKQEWQSAIRKFSALESLTQHQQFQNTTQAQMVSQKIGELKARMTAQFEERMKTEEELQKAQRELERIRALEQERQYLLVTLPIEHEQFKKESKCILSQLHMTNRFYNETFNGLGIANRKDRIQAFVKKVKQDLNQIDNLYQKEEQLAKNYQKIGEIMTGAVDKNSVNLVLRKLNTQLSLVIDFTSFDLEKIELENLQQRVKFFLAAFTPKAVFSSRDRIQAATL